MKVAVFIIFGVAASVLAKPAPYFDPVTAYGRGIYGTGLGYPSGGFNSGGSGFSAGNGGYLQQGFGNRGSNILQDQGHHERDYESSVRGHESSSHNLAAGTDFVNGANTRQGYGGFGQQNSIYNNGWNSIPGIGLI